MLSTLGRSMGLRIERSRGFDLLHQLVWARRLIERADGGIVIHLDAQLGPDSFQHGKHLCILLLAEQIDLEVEMVASFADSRIAVLADENEGREETGLQ